MKQIDVVEFIGRCLKVPADGLRLWDDGTQKSYLAKPIDCGNLRLFNRSSSGQIYVLATPFGTFICPGFSGIATLLKDHGFEKVGDDIIPVPYSSYVKPNLVSDDFATEKPANARSKARIAFNADWNELRSSYYNSL